ncbi:MAG: GvpL/GvpF family gas vesicle protein [Acidobacteriota bacterium]
MSYQYLYGFTRARELPPLTGLADAPVTAVTRDGLSAATSAFPRAKVRPSRRHLLAHDQTLRALQTVGVLPVAFGTVSDTVDSIGSLLERHGEQIRANLDRLEGRIEMTAKARIGAANPFERMVAHSPELRKARDRMAASGKPDRDTMIAIGKLFADVLEAERRRVKELFVGGVAEASEAVQENDPKAEHQLFDLSFLLTADGVGAWEAAVDRIAGDLDDDLVIDLAGPHPPYSFSTLELAAVVE